MALSDEMRRLTQDLLEANNGRMVAVADIRTATAQQLVEFQGAHQAMSEEQRQELAKYAGGLRRDMATFLKELDAAHQAMSEEQRQDLSGYVGGLRRDMATFLKELDAAHQAMSEEQRRQLAADHQRLTADVSAIRSRLQADQSEAHEVLAGFNTLMQQRRAGRPAAPPPPRPSPIAEAPPPPPVEEVAPPPALKAPPAAEEEVAADDLTVIRGIGASLQMRLNQVGIRTYAQLAESTPEELREAAGGLRLANVEDWIERARKLAEQT